MYKWIYIIVLCKDDEKTCTNYTYTKLEYIYLSNLHSYSYKLLAHLNWAILCKIQT